MKFDNTTVKYNKLNQENRMDFIENCANGVFFYDDNNELIYAPSLLDNLKHILIAIYYFDYNYIEGNNAEDDKDYEEFMTMNIYDIINNSNIDYSQFLDIECAIDEKVDFRKQQMLYDRLADRINQNNPIRELTDGLLSMIKTIEKKTAEFSAVDLANALPQVQELSDRLKSVSNKDIVKALKPKKSRSKKDDSK